MSSVSNGLYFLTLPLVSVMRVIYRKIRHARYLSKNTSCALSIHKKECRKSLGCALYIRCALSIEKYGNWRGLNCRYHPTSSMAAKNINSEQAILKGVAYDLYTPFRIGITCRFPRNRTRDSDWTAQLRKPGTIRVWGLSCFYSIKRPDPS